MRVLKENCYKNVEASRKKEMLIILLLFAFTFLFRTLISIKYGMIRTTTDELRYIQFAQSFANGHSTVARGTRFNYTRILYPLLISFSYHIFPDPIKAYKVILTLNALFVSLAFFPIYGMCKRFFSNKKEIFLVLFLCCIIFPENNYSLYIVQENLYYLLMCISLFLVVKFVFECKKADKLLVFQIGIVSFLLYITKEIGLVFILSVLIILPIILWLNDIKNKIMPLSLIYLVTTISPIIFYRGICNRFLTSPIISSSSNTLSRILSHFSDATLFANAPYIALWYIFSIIVVTAFFPIIMIVIGYDKMYIGEKCLVIFCGIYYFLSALVTYVDFYEELVTFRFHYRYLFHVYPLLIILFISLFKHDLNSISKNKIITIIILVIGISLVWDNFSNGSLIDCLYFALNDYDSFDAMDINSVKALTLISLAIIMACFELKKTHLIKIVAIVSIFIVSIYTNVCIWRNSRDNILSENVQMSIHDVNIINNYFEHNGVSNDDKENILVLGNGPAMYECFLRPQYMYSVLNEFINYWKVSGKIDFEDINYYGIRQDSGYGYSYKRTNHLIPQYIITQKCIDFIGYNEEAIGLSKIHLYKNVGSYVNISDDISGVTADDWVLEEGMNIYFTSEDNTDSTAHIMLSLTNNLFPKGLDVHISDGAGNGNIIELQPGENTIYLDVHRNEETDIFYVKIVAQDYRIVGEDPRHLTFMLKGFEVNERN